jgi:heptosyltransferase-2
MSIPTSRVLVIHLEAIGAVMRSTALLPSIRRRFPGSHITWVTQRPADQILHNNPMIDRILTTTADDLLQLSVLEFDVALVVDKSLKAAGVLKATRADMVFGFTVEAASGAVLPATPAAEELWQIGLSNGKKFFQNQKTETQLVHEALELGTWHRDEYVLRLTDREQRDRDFRRSTWARQRQVLVGLNTGCAPTIPAKKLTIEMHRDLVRRLNQELMVRVVLLGGRDETLRNQRIAHGLDAILSPTDRGLRDGIVSVAACDIVVTGDSLGMHLAVALKKWTVAWFGPTCAHEVDLYERGVSVLTQASCSPCWKRSCDKDPMCHDLVSVDTLIAGVKAGIDCLPTREMSTDARSDFDRGHNWQNDPDLNT